MSTLKMLKFHFFRTSCSRFAFDRHFILLWMFLRLILLSVISGLSFPPQTEILKENKHFVSSSEPDIIPEATYGDSCCNSNPVQSKVAEEGTESFASPHSKNPSKEIGIVSDIFSSKTDDVSKTDENSRVTQNEHEKFESMIESEDLKISELSLDAAENSSEKNEQTSNTEKICDENGSIGKGDHKKIATVDPALNDSENMINEEETVVTSKDNYGEAVRTTPKQLKKQQSERKRQEKLKERKERLEKKQEERERLRQEKLKLKQEKQVQKQKELEQKHKEKEFKEEQKRKEKEQKRREKDEKEEQRKKEKEQERLKKQQELEERNREKQKLEEQKQKAAAAFVNFFVPKKSENDDKKAEECRSSLFKNFEVKSDMRLPPERRKPLSIQEKNALINYIINQDHTGVCSYLTYLKNTKSFGKCGKTWPYEDPVDDVTIIEDDNDLGETICEDKGKTMRMKAKFFKFHENRRPPYLGTWRKKSATVKPRKPLALDEIFNYEEDSDDDWEEEEQGESLDDSDGDEKETEGNDDYEVDNDFFVPHGHLSDDEVDDETTSKLSPESHKQKLKLLKEEFDEYMKSKTNRIKPRFIGCVWYDREGKNIDEPLDRFLKPLSIITNGFVVLKKRNIKAQHKETDLKLTELDPSLIPELIKLVHGNMNKKTTLITEFLVYMNKHRFDITVTKASLGRKIKQIAQWMKCPEDGPMHNKFCWYVPLDIRRKYDLILHLPNQWGKMSG